MKASMADDHINSDRAARQSQQDWSEYRRFVLQELERINKVISQMSDKVERLRIEDLSSLKTELALLKFQAGLWGAGGGMVFAAIVNAVLRFWIH